jgi:hypothetical protein
VPVPETAAPLVRRERIFVRTMLPCDEVSVSDVWLAQVWLLVDMYCTSVIQKWLAIPFIRELDKPHCFSSSPNR